MVHGQSPDGSPSEMVQTVGVDVGEDGALVAFEAKAGAPSQWR